MNTEEHRQLLKPETQNGWIQKLHFGEYNWQMDLACPQMEESDEEDIDIPRGPDNRRGAGRI